MRSSQFLVFCFQLLTAFKQVLLKIFPLLPVKKGFLLFFLLFGFKFVYLFSQFFVLGLQISDFLFKLCLCFTQMVVTFNLHVFEFLEELFLFCILSFSLLSEMLDLLQVKRLLLVKFTIGSNLNTIGFFLLF